MSHIVHNEACGCVRMPDSIMTPTLPSVGRMNDLELVRFSRMSRMRKTLLGIATYTRMRGETSRDFADRLRSIAGIAVHADDLAQDKK